ncbi:hypothetical protein VTK26DRAFT_5336 [Humicola hyalothermophila]
MRGGPRLQVGSAAWIAEERDAALNIAQSEIDEFSFSARNEIDWLNEHMAEIFSENQMNVAELFKTPGKLRGKTPWTVRNGEPGSLRMPLSDVFSATSKGAPNPFALSHISQPRSPDLVVAEDKPESPVTQPTSPPKPAVVHPPHPVAPRHAASLADSGYHGSQSQDTMNFDQFDKEDVEMADSPQRSPETREFGFSPPAAPAEQPSPSIASIDETFRSTHEDQSRHAAAKPITSAAPTPSSAMMQPSSPFASRTRLPIMSPRSPSPQKMSSPVKHSPQKSSSSPIKSKLASPQKGLPRSSENLGDMDVDEGDDEAGVQDVRSPSEASSPIRRPVRQSSINFASLPAREPLASKKSLGGARMSRTSQLDFSRPSYYNRHTGGKSLGTAIRRDSSGSDHDEMDVDDEMPVRREGADSNIATHSKTYTQRLQDQISMLGKAQPTGPRPSKSLASLLPSQANAPAPQSQPHPESALESEKQSSPKQNQSTAAPGAFPEDDEDEWIAPPKATAVVASPKPAPSRPLTAEMEDLAGKGHANSSEIQQPMSRPASPGKPLFSPSRTANPPSHGKSRSVPVFPTLAQLNMDSEEVCLQKTVSNSNPALSSVAEDDFPSSPPKSPARAFRDNPLKQVKNKIQSLLKSSKGLMVSSAAISAEGKSSLLQSPSTAALGHHHDPSVESFRTADSVVYPDLSQQVSAMTAAPLSPVRSNSSRTTRRSTERERAEAKEREREEREREKEAKETKRAADKLEKAREKEAEKKARGFNKEQEKIAAMERQIVAQKEREKVAQAQAQPTAQDFRTPGPPPRHATRSPPKTTRTTPRKTKDHGEEGKQTAAPTDNADHEMVDAPSTVPPQSIPRPATASSMRIPAAAKRPLKPNKETLTKPKQAPTVIRVNTTSSQQTQFHPSNRALAANLRDTLGQPPASKPLKSKASQTSLRAKSPATGLKTSTSDRPKPMDLAAKRREQEERDMQRKRPAQEERRQEQQSKAEAERQREAERKKKEEIERAKQTKAPPPAVRSQPNGPPEYAAAEKAPARPPSRLGSTMHQEGRLVNTVLSKAPSKRQLQQDEEESYRSQQRGAPPLQSHESSKRQRISQEFDEDLDMADSHNQRIIKGPPIRPSGGFKKDLPAKSTFSTTPAPSASMDLFRATVTAQHNSHQAKAARPLDMAQLSKGTIPFAPANTTKTPARPGPAGPKSAAKSAARSSPRFQNGESIELPDIQTDDDDSDDDSGGGGRMPVAAWADSPALKAALLAQERVDPMQVFGPPAPLNMEEVFSKTKDRWHKFRARTSSANWSGSDRLTEEEMRKDMAARDKMRREGGWSYELGREMA